MNPFPMGASFEFFVATVNHSSENGCFDLAREDQVGVGVDEDGIMLCRAGQCALDEF